MPQIRPQFFSFKDSAARVVEKDGIYYRYIFQEYKKEYDHLILSGLYDELVARSLIISHTEELLDTSDSLVYKTLKPEQLLFKSYPFEWSYSQWRKVLLDYIEINIIEPDEYNT